jgi:hypothetical protein
MRLLGILTTFALITTTIQSALPTKHHLKMGSISTVYQYPLPTWIENIAVRPNGHLLVSFLTGPELHLIDPLSTPPTDTLIHSFANTTTGITGLLGIAELSPDIFAFVAGAIPQTATPGKYSIWSADFTSTSDNTPAVVKKVADVPGGELLNGMAKVNEHTLLIADSMKGVIWSLDTLTGQSVIALDHESLKAGHDDAGNFIKSGINGLRVDDDRVYYTNSFTGDLSKVAIDCETGEIQGEVETIAKGMVDADDFAIGKDGKVYVTRNTGSLVVVLKSWGKADIAGLEAKDVSGPTSAAFGRTKRDEDVLYVSTIGRVNGTFVEGGKIVAIKI